MHKALKDLISSTAKTGAAARLPEPGFGPCFFVVSLRDFVDCKIRPAEGSCPVGRSYCSATLFSAASFLDNCSFVFGETMSSSTPGALSDPQYTSKNIISGIFPCIFCDFCMATSPAKNLEQMIIQAKAVEKDYLPV